jgi:hypothetical protein
MNRPPKNFLTPAHNELFDDRIIYWQKRLGLEDWRVVRSRRHCPDMASIKVDHQHRLATYSTGNFGSAEITPESIDSTALHEMLHLLLAELLEMTVESDHAELRMAAEHRVVITLERILAGTQ